MRHLLLLAALALFATGCLTGDSYPDQWSRAACGSLYACVDEDQIEDWLGYDDEGECVEENAEDIRQSTAYDEYEEGDREFNSDNASECIDEAAEVRNDSDCGDMNVLTYFLDISTEECTEVYE